MTHQSKLLVQDHLLQQRRLVVEEMRLHVAPHVGEPPELIHVLQQQVISRILLSCDYAHTHTHTHAHTHTHTHTHTHINALTRPSSVYILAGRLRLWCLSL